MFTKTYIWTDILKSNVKKLNVNKIQIFNNIHLRILTNTPNYVSNYTLYSDLKLKTISEKAKI